MPSKEPEDRLVAKPGESRPEPAEAEDREHTQPAEEWGQRHEAGKAIHRGGKAEGDVPGATP